MGLFSWDRTPFIPIPQASYSTSNNFSKFKSVKTKVLLAFYLIKAKPFYAFSPCSNFFFFMHLVIGAIILLKFHMNH